jgi:hypothetical protein
VRKTENLVRLLHLSPTGNLFCIFTLFLLWFAGLAVAGEPDLTLTAANSDQSSVGTNIIRHAEFLSIADTSLFELKDCPTESPRPENEMKAEFTTLMRLEKQAKLSQREPLQLIHENRVSASRSNITFSVQAGYGRIWDEKSMLQKISDGHQETGCAYVSANFSF